MSRELNEAAKKWLRENDWDYQKYGDRRGDRSAYDTLMNYEVSDHLEDAFLAGAAWQREQDADKLEKAAEHHAKSDQHAAWDRSRVDCEPCFEPGHSKYHSYPGYAAHVVGQMAKVIRGETTVSSDVPLVAADDTSEKRVAEIEKSRHEETQNDPCPRECPEQGTVHFHAGHAQNENADECNETNGWCYNCAICKNLMDPKKESQDERKGEKS